ncbi:MAG TPA: hypothetical protein PLY96_12760 [Chromatiaceae bacterium]|nr:hypothetical protein [Chromatiaceae bacterium]
MAKVKGPLMSLDASGTIAGDTRLRHMRGHVLMYRGGEPGSVRRQAPSASQAQVRAKFAEARARWRTLNPQQRAYWQDVARELDAGLTAWNCFLSCVLLGGAAGSTGYQVPPLSETITLKAGYSPPPVASPLLFALTD